MAVIGGASLGIAPAMGVQTTLPVSEQPLPNTARVLDGHIYGIASNGTTTVVVGDFTTVRDYAAGSPQQTRNDVMAYDQSTGRVSQTFVPVVDGVVNAVSLTPDGTQVLIAGLFKNVNGTPHRGIARLNLADGSLDPSFRGTTSGGVLDMGVTQHEIIIGGYFDMAGGLRRPRLAALDPQTGMAIPAFNFTLSGVLHPDHQDQQVQVRELDVSADGRWLVTVGNQTEINGVHRGQVALIDLSNYTLADWSVPQLDGWPCSRRTDAITWVLDASFSPDSRYVVTGAMGAFNQGTLCDSVARFELPPVATGAVSPTWVDYTGGDSLFKIKVTDAAVYAGGHQRWFNNPTPESSSGTIGGDQDGPGAIPRYGIGALDPTTGVPLSWFPNRDGARPQRGFEAIETYGDLLLLGSDSTRIGGQVRQRVAAYTTAGGAPNPAPEQVSLPVNLYVLGTDNVLRRTSFDGSHFGPLTAVSGSSVDGVDWSGARDGFVQRGSLVSFGTDGAYYQRSFSGSVGAPVNLSSSVGYSDDGSFTPFDEPYGVQHTTAAAYVGGRIIYTRDDSTKLYWRWYSLQSGIIGSDEFVLDDTRRWGTDVSAMEVIGDKLYAVARSGALVAFQLSVGPASVSVAPGAPTMIDSRTSGIDWRRVRGLFAAPAGSPPVG